MFTSELKGTTWPRQRTWRAVAAALRFNAATGALPRPAGRSCNRSRAMDSMRRHVP